MHRFAVPVGAFVVILLFSSIGCAGSDSNPLTPPSEQESPALTGTAHTAARNPGPYLWGLYDILIHADTGQAEIVPLRTPLFEANVTRFLQPPLSPVHLLSIAFLPDSDFLLGYVVCDVTIRHPFPGTRFAGFDVKGIVMGETGIPCQWDPALGYADGNSVQLLNADGWTRWWNQAEFTTEGTIFGYTEGALASHAFDSAVTLNPYKYFADELDEEASVHDVTEAGRGFFSSENPGLNKRRYELQFAGAPLPMYHYKYAISADWVMPLDGSTAPWTQEDFGMSANQPEPFRLEIIDDGSTVFYENSTYFGGDLNLHVHVSDWQLLDGGPAEAQMAGAYFESPTLFPEVFGVFGPGLFDPGPDPMTVSFSVSIPDVTPGAVDDQLIIMHVPSLNPSTYEPQIQGPTGFVWPQDAYLAAHLIWEVPISPVGPQQNEPPVADASATDPTMGQAPLTVHLDPSNSFDPDGVIVLYEWDFENDGMFDVSTVAPDIVDQVFSAPGEHFVNLRVTDDGGLDDELDEPLIITVTLGGTWSQLQDSINHVGDIAKETELYPPLELLWSATLTSGTASWIEGTPIVGEGYVMVLYTDRFSNWAECFNFETGDWVWKVDISPGGKQSYVGPQTGCYGDGRFYAPGDEVRALDPATGEILWNYDPDSRETERHGLVFENGRVLVHLSNKIHILDAATGDELDIVSVGIGYANFQPFSLLDGVAYCQLSSAVAAYDLNGGGQLWYFSVDPPLFGIDRTVRGAPTVPGDGYVYFGCYNAYHYALNQSDGSLAWKVPINGGTLRQFDTGAYADGRLYYGEGSGNTDETGVSRLACLDAATGADIWEYVSPSGGHWGCCSPIVANGVVYAACTGGEFVGCDAVTGELLWSFDAPDKIQSDPAVVDGHLLFISEDRTLWCFVNEE